MRVERVSRYLGLLRELETNSLMYLSEQPRIPRSVGGMSNFSSKGNRVKIFVCLLINP